MKPWNHLQPVNERTTPMTDLRQRLTELDAFLEISERCKNAVTAKSQ